jgi:hypothetical protein
MAYGPVDPLPTAPRYTTLDEVKRALMITDTASDADLTQAIIASEVAIDLYNARSFPDDSTAEPIHGDEIDGIPEAVKLQALSVSIQVYKLRDDTGGGTVGSDDWIGTIDVGEIVKRSVRYHPLALGFKRGWGLS